MVAFVRRQGISGVGQSSWGPAIFAIVPDPERAEDLARRLEGEFALTQGEIVVTAAANRGAAVF